VDERRRHPAGREADRRAVSRAGVRRDVADRAAVEELAEPAEDHPERGAGVRDDRAPFVDLPARQRERPEAEADEPAADAPRVAIGERLHVPAVRDEDARRRAPPRAGGEEPRVAGADVPLAAREEVDFSPHGTPCAA